ncbi:MAG: histidine--tRNA ligase [Alphaproteobacteria bacterium]|nr:histidine--tRNA ligase [Alphaproteobacteria bacterium]
MITPRTAAGTLELLPREQRVFQHMFDIIRRGYEKFGFNQIETPVFEMRDVLLTKSGGETEKQVYFVQSTGGIQQGHEADMALRFDLTVPLARYVAEHERDLAFPFRRYQMQRVYRGERAQRGRFREFYQCDIDVIGKDKLSPAYDAEIPAIIVQIFEELKVGDFTIHFSNRKILRGLLAGYGVEDEEKQKLILREIDKLDKIGADKVHEAMVSLGLTNIQAQQLLSLITSQGTKDEIVELLRVLDQKPNEVFAQGLAEVTQVVETLRAMGVPEKRTRLNLSIARGLDYYTGTVYETLLDAHPEFGSVCSGGRYDDLAGHYTKSNLPGVGISIGLTRLFDQLNANGLLPPAPATVQILVAQLDPALAPHYLALATELRSAGFTVEAYLEPSKLDKQIKYADKAGIPVVLLLGGDEQAKGTVVVKDMAQKTQSDVARGDLAATLRGILGA